MRAIYIVDGHRLAGDMDHGAHDPNASGLDTVAAALEQRQALSLAHDADGYAAARAGDRHRDLRSLRLERETLEAILAEAPSSSVETLLAARRHRDALLARRQLWQTRLAEAANALEATKGHPLRASTDMSTAQREIVRVDKALAGIEPRIAHHEGRQADRAAFLAEHADDFERADLLRRAERACELQVRTAALDDIPDDVIEPRTPARVSRGTIDLGCRRRRDRRLPGTIRSTGAAGRAERRRRPAGPAPIRCIGTPGLGQRSGLDRAGRWRTVGALSSGGNRDDRLCARTREGPPSGQSDSMPR